MVYCSNCGAPLAGARRFCSSCGYKLDMIKEKKPEEEIMTAEIVDGGEKDQVQSLDTTCVECDNEASQKCYFCWANICVTHTKYMQIFINKAPFGNRVVSCRKCSDEKHGMQPLQSEAEGASFFFGVKPYHEWKLVK